MAEQAYQQQAAGWNPYAAYASYSAAWSFSHPPATGAHPAYGSQPQAGGQALYGQTHATSSCPPCFFPANMQGWDRCRPSKTDASTMTSQEHPLLGSAPLHATAKGSSGESFLP
jgi:hypothetical protein